MNSKAPGLAQLISAAIWALSERVFAVEHPRAWINAPTVVGPFKGSSEGSTQSNLTASKGGSAGDSAGFEAPTPGAATEAGGAGEDEVLEPTHQPVTRPRHAPSMSHADSAAQTEVTLLVTSPHR